MTATPSPYPPQGGAPAYGPGPAGPWGGAPGVAPRPAPRGRKGPLILLISGLVLLVLGVVLVVVPLAGVVKAGTSLSSISSSGSSVATLESNAIYGLYEDSPHSTSCSVTDPSGRDVATSSVSGTVTTNDHRMFATFTTTSEGKYTIICESTSGDAAYVGVALSVSGIVGMAFGVIAGVAAGLVGLGLTIGGFIWLVLRNRAIRQSRDGQAGPYPGAPGGYAPQGGGGNPQQGGYAPQSGAWPAS